MTPSGLRLTDTHTNNYIIDTSPIIYSDRGEKKMFFCVFKFTFKFIENLPSSSLSTESTMHRTIRNSCRVASYVNYAIMRWWTNIWQWQQMQWQLNVVVVIVDYDSRTRKWVKIQNRQWLVVEAVYNNQFLIQTISVRVCSDISFQCNTNYSVFSTIKLGVRRIHVNDSNRTSKVFLPF